MTDPKTPTTGLNSVETATAPPRGVLHLEASAPHYHLTRVPPPAELQPFVALFWLVQWDLRGKPPHLQQNIPDPCIHLVVEEANTRVVGVVKGRFSRTLEGKGRILGVKFKPGGFFPFIGSPVSAFTQRELGVQQAFGVDSQTLERPFVDLAEEESDQMISMVRDFLMDRVPPMDPNVQRVQRWVQWIATDPTLMRVESLVERTRLSSRSVQRLFKDYVGVSPKWTIRVCRIQEALERIASRETDWAALALDLGYFDQAHFIGDFKALVGVSPGSYGDPRKTLNR